MSDKKEPAYERKAIKATPEQVETNDARHAKYASERAARTGKTRTTPEEWIETAGFNRPVTLPTGKKEKEKEKEKEKDN